MGLRRQGKFWLRVLPVVFDYYWNFASSSPYVKYQKWKLSTTTTTTQGTTTQGTINDNKQKLHQLHQRHAPTILQVMLDLKGLYIKLGQVLSVTSLPIPNEYRVLFRTLQSDVPGWEDFQTVVRPVLEQEFGRPDLSQIFRSIDPVPCGAASIGQAHRAKLITTTTSTGGDGKQQQQQQQQQDDHDTVDVIIKVQYPDAAWQVPADIRCVGDFLQLCVYTGVVDEAAANLSFGEFSRQFLAELDYHAEQLHLREIHASSVRPHSPYLKRGVVVPRVYEEWCTQKVITMTYLPGPKLEEEARRQLEMLGIDTSKGIRGVLERNRTSTKQVQDDDMDHIDDDQLTTTTSRKTSTSTPWLSSAAKIVGYTVGLDSVFWMARAVRRFMLWSTAAAVSTVQTAAPVLPQGWEDWAKSHQTAAQQAKRLALTESWIDALFDVHGDQIFCCGLFNADAHPGNILVLDDDDDDQHTKNRLGLIDFGQCKRLTPEEQAKVARLVVSVANGDSDEQIANVLRSMGMKTKHDSTEFMATFARLMFGRFRPYHLDSEWHRKVHRMDSIVYFPNELSMVYRTSMLLRGLAMSLQINVSVGDLWRKHAQEAIDRYEATTEGEQQNIWAATNKQQQQQTRKVVLSTGTSSSGSSNSGKGEQGGQVVMS